MRILLILLASIPISACVTTSETVTVRGVLLSTDPPILFTECGSDRIIELGVMASTPYFRLTSQIKDLATVSEQPILVEVSGTMSEAEVSSRPRNYVVVRSPQILAVSNEVCLDNPTGQRAALGAD